MNRTLVVVASTVLAVAAGAAAGLLGSAEALANGDDTSGSSSERGPYGPGTGVTPPAAQGTGVGGGPTDRTSSAPEQTTTSGAEAQRGKPLVPGTGVGRKLDEQREGSQGTTAAPDASSDAQGARR